MPRILNLSQKLIRLKTTEDNPQEIERCLSLIKKYLNPKLILKKYESDRKLSFVITTKKTHNPKIFFVSHVDVVNGADEQFIPKVKRGRLYGRGSWDMKVYLALMLTLFNELPSCNNSPDVGLIITSDQETGGDNGTKFLLKELHYSSEVAFVPDAGNDLDIVNIEKGVLHLKLSAKGKTAHGSRPWMGENALDTLISTYMRLHAIFPNPTNDQDWKTSLSLGKIEGGRAINQVPDQGALYLDLRYTERQTPESILRLIRKVAKNLSLEVLANGSICYTPEDHPFLQKYMAISNKILGRKVKFNRECEATDGRYFSDRGIPVIITRSQGSDAHGKNEWVAIEPLSKFYEIIKQF
ncbi:MAG: M20/M25/M40 family metallo-hydrolase, partial [Patescibacteria group bacterium]